MSKEENNNQPRKKNLNILNTDRHYNCNLLRREEVEDKIKVTRLNEKSIEKEMDKLAKESRRFPKQNKKEYLIYQEKYTNDRLIEKLIKHGGAISYYTSTIVPYYILTQLAMNLNSEVVYSNRKPFSNKDQENIELSYMATKVIIDVPVVIPDISPYEVLFNLECLKTNVDSVQLSFPPLHKSEISERHKEYYTQKGDYFYAKPHYKHSYFTYVQTSMSLWKMNIWILTDDDEDHEAMQKYIDKELNRRRGKTNKKKKVGETK